MNRKATSKKQAQSLLDIVDYLSKRDVLTADVALIVQEGDQIKIDYEAHTSGATDADYKRVNKIINEDMKKIKEKNERQGAEPLRLPGIGSVLRLSKPNCKETKRVLVVKAVGEYCLIDLNDHVAMNFEGKDMFFNIPSLIESIKSEEWKIYVENWGRQK